MKREKAIKMSQSKQKLKMYKNSIKMQYYWLKTSKG